MCHSLFSLSLGVIVSYVLRLQNFLDVSFTIFMPSTLKKSGGHIALGLSIHPSFHPFTLLRPLISLEPFMLGFLNFIYAVLMQN